jgi:adenosylhomocysteine nucleosidase
MRFDEVDLTQNPDFVILISADAEWRAMLTYFSDKPSISSPYGNWFYYSYQGTPELLKSVIFLHGGWGKVAAAGSTQYAISRWQPKLVVNLGTCGGFEGVINRGDIILVEKTIIYDIFEQMGDPEEHIQHYLTEIDNSWIREPTPLAVVRSLLVSGDRDLCCAEIPTLKSKYGAIAGDWESGAIAWVAARNLTPCLILRGVTDLVSEQTGEAYDGNVGYYYENTELIMGKLVESLPLWLKMYSKHKAV